jgi:hypothetical protein
VDGTGFGTSVYDCRNDEKHGSTKKRRKPTPSHRWVDAKIVFGTGTHVIPAAVDLDEDLATRERDRVDALEDLRELPQSGLYRREA